MWHNSRYLVTTVTNQNLIQDEIQRRLNSINACYHSVQNLLSSRLLPENVKITIYKTIILLVVLYGCETWSLTLREEHTLSVFENRVLRSKKMYAYKVLVGKPEGNRTLGRPRRMWMDNIKKGLRETGWDEMDWINLAQERDQWRSFVNTVMNLQVSSNAGIFLRSCTTGSFSRTAPLHGAS
ncbi:hypothetical protein B7P43_G08490 [Cryptotermes secundus]|uniref:Uncharacterized protein n=1 Tax=Cryptotermes secundus TaxID=105785 RepID=A0A2J7PQD9_9NEOP|nr:hypothetical protein B7P43_G08490 [Cryptotermes secundus]